MRKTKKKPNISFGFFLAERAEVFAHHGFSAEAAADAGAVIDKVKAGEHITNKDIDKLDLFSDAGVAAVNEALGTDMQRQYTASNMRKAFREAVAQYEKTSRQNVDKADRTGYTENRRSREAQSIIDRITAGETVSNDVAFGEKPRLIESSAQRDEQASVGAAKTGFDPYTNAANEYGTIEPGEYPARVVDVPKSINGKDRVGRLVRTAMEAKITPDHMIPEIERKVIEAQFSKRPSKNREQLARAMNWMNRRADVKDAYEAWRETALSEGVSAQTNARGIKRKIRKIYNELN